jgi:uncharacterized protein (DUF1697 family)
VTTYVALLRGIAPMNPSMRNERLREVAESVGLDKVRTVISSGNLVFESDTGEPAALESELEEAWTARLGFESTTIIRSREEIEGLVVRRPFGDLDHGPATYLLVTFAKHRLTVDLELPHRPSDRDYRLVSATDWELFTVTDTTTDRAPDVMVWLEGRFGKEITSRTWLTVLRIAKRMREG